MIKRLLLCLALLASANAAEIQPAGGAINRARINYAATYDADASDFFTRVEANAGTISTSTRVAVNAFVVAAKANGYWTKLTRINLFCGDQLAAALVPLKVGGGNATDTNVNLDAGDYSEATGLSANGTDEYLQTGLVPSTSLTLNSTHLAIYNRSSSAATGGAFGSSSSATEILRVYAPFIDAVFYSDQYDQAGTRAQNAVTAPYGFLVATRTASNANSIYRNGALLTTNAGASTGTLPTHAIYVFATNTAGTAGLFMSAPVGGYSIGAGLTGANVTSYNTDLEAFQDALGRGVQ